MSPRFVPSIAIALFLAGCASTTVPLAATPAAPSARGVVTTSESSQGNLMIKLVVTRLAAAAKVVPGATVYVVWVAKTGGSPQNLGALTLDEEMKGHLEARTPLHGFEIFVTAEEAETGGAPSGPRVLSAEINQ